MVQQLQALPMPHYLCSFSALDRYFRHPYGENLYVTVHGGLVDLARQVGESPEFGELEFPGLDYWDAALPHNEGHIYFRCLEDPTELSGFAYDALELLFDPRLQRFLDRADAYADLRSRQPSTPRRGDADAFWDAAVLCARYGFNIADTTAPPASELTGQPLAEQRRRIIDIVCGTYAVNGLEMLMDSGAVAVLFPELQPMNGTSHSKEEHPEGNVWQHSLETMRYRKTKDLRVAMALLLHDCGKPYAQPTRGRIFDRHAELGVKTAVSLLRRLGFSQSLIDDVAWLIRNHMLPGALHRLPTYRSESAMASPLFPLLLEVYRCDLASTFRGPEGYYRACKVYRSFLKNKANPFRAADGKKLLRMYVE